MADDIRDDVRLAEAVKAACRQAVLRGYEDAAISGLCHEGAFEAAVGALEMLNVEEVITQLQRENRK